MASSLARTLPLVIALAGASAAPISALAHGYAHQHEAADYNRPAHDVAIAEHTDHSAGEHEHPLIGAALTSKVATALVAVLPRRVVVPASTVVLLMPPVAEVTVEHRAQLAQAPPPRLRAPPA